MEKNDINHPFNRDAQAASVEFKICMLCAKQFIMYVCLLLFKSNFVVQVMDIDELLCISFQLYAVQDTMEKTVKQVCH